MPVSLKKLGQNEIEHFKELILLFAEVFEMKYFNLPEDQHLQNLLNQNSFTVIVALSDNKVVGGLTAYTLQQFYSAKPLVYLYDLGINPSFQRHGVGTLLIAALNSYCSENGMAEVFVQADKTDEHATAFYRSTGAAEAEVIHFYYHLTENTK